MAMTLATKPWRPWAKRALPLALFCIIAYLLYIQLRSIDWQEVVQSLRRRPPGTLLAAAGLAAASYALYSCYDLIGRHVTHHALRVRQVMMVNFLSYAFGLNIGSVVGGLAMRYRLYSRLGLSLAQITRVAAVSILTNWLGYTLLAGIVFLFAPIALPPEWKFHAASLQAAGLLLLGMMAAYLALCARAHGKTWHIRGHAVPVPSLRLAMLQFGMAAGNWLLMAATVFIAMEQKIAFPEVLLALLGAAIAGVVVRVPASLGVLETVFFVLMMHQLPKSELLAGLLTYRAVYYLLPLLVAAVAYLSVELRLKRDGRRR